MTRIVCEISANHLGGLDRALELVRQAHYAGADAVKLQTWAPGMMVLDSHLKLTEGPWAGRLMADLYQEALLPWEHQAAVYAEAHRIGIECFSSVFDMESLAFLEDLGCPRYKISSFELIDLPLIEAVARTGKPIIMSTGMGTHTEVEAAVNTARAAGAVDITLLKCTSAYPAKAESANLATMGYYQRRFLVYPGISDHTPGIGVAVIAATLGADMIEKHFTLNRADGGLDAEFSIEPKELADLVTQVRMVPVVMGTSRAFAPHQDELPQRLLRRSLYFARPLQAGHKVKPGDVRTARPALGLAPKHLPAVIGNELVRNVIAGEPVTWHLLMNQETR